MRGDRPFLKKPLPCSLQFTPHARGSTFPPNNFSISFLVYPACAGIDHWLYKRICRFSRLPRMRGDRPFCRFFPAPHNSFTPHARGSTCDQRIIPFTFTVYPACAGIDLPFFVAYFSRFCLPRMRGDRPLLQVSINKAFPFTPHARGSTAGLRV